MKNKCELSTLLADEATWVNLKELMLSFKAYPIMEVFRELQDLDRLSMESQERQPEPKVLLSESCLPLYMSPYSTAALTVLRDQKGNYMNPILPMVMDLIFSAFYEQAYYKSGVDLLNDWIYIDVDLGWLALQIFPSDGRKSIYMSRRKWITTVTKAVTQFNELQLYGSTVSMSERKKDVLVLKLAAKLRNQLLESKKEDIVVLNHLPASFYRFCPGYINLPADVFIAPRLLLSHCLTQERSLTAGLDAEETAKDSFTFPMDKFLRIMHWDTYQAWFRSVHANNRRQVSLRNLQRFFNDMFKYTGLFNIQLLYTAQSQDVQVKITPATDLDNLL